MTSRRCDGTSARRGRVTLANGATIDADLIDTSTLLASVRDALIRHKLEIPCLLAAEVEAEMDGALEEIGPTSEEFVELATDDQNPTPMTGVAPPDIGAIVPGTMSNNRRRGMVYLPRTPAACCSPRGPTGVTPRCR